MPRRGRSTPSRGSRGGPAGKSKRAKKGQTRLTDLATEADEMGQKAGEKGTPPREAEDFPRSRANKRRGGGTLANDRPPMQGVVGRSSGPIRLTVWETPQPQPRQPRGEPATRRTATVSPHESSADTPVSEPGRAPHPVGPSQREDARDEEGDGVRAVHGNPRAGSWTGWRTFLRPLRGVHKQSLAPYVAGFDWAPNLKPLPAPFLRLVIGHSSNSI